MGSSTRTASTTSPTAHRSSSTTASPPSATAPTVAPTTSLSRTAGALAGAALATSRWLATDRTTAALPPRLHTPKSKHFFVFDSLLSSTADLLSNKNVRFEYHGS